MDMMTDIRQKTKAVCEVVNGAGIKCSPNFNNLFMVFFYVFLHNSFCFLMCTVFSAEVHDLFGPRAAVCDF